MTGLKYLKNVSTLALAPEKCTGCGMCVQVCPHSVFELHSKKAIIIDKDRCMEYGACSRNCPFDAVTVRAGVGCAWVIFYGKRHKIEPTCGCSPESCCG